MKKALWIVAICGATLFSACTKEEVGFGDLYNGELTDYVIDLEKTDDLTLDASAQEITLRVGANYWWSVATEFIHQEDEYETDWFAILSEEESFGNQPIKVSFTRNIEQRERSVRLIFSAQDNPAIKREITVTQRPAELFLEVDKTEQQLSILAQPFEVVLSTSSDWVLEKPDWIHADKMSGTPTRDEIIALTVNLNETGNNLEGELIFRSKSEPAVEQVINVVQSGIFKAPQISVTNGEELKLTFRTEAETVYYMLSVYPENEDTEPLVQQRIDSFEATEEFDLTTLDYGSYVGRMRVQVAAHLSDNYYQTSNTVTTHNYFDDASGDGTSEEQACIVRTVRHFRNVAKALDRYIRQAEDLDLTGISPVPAGTASTPFSGTYDGNGRKIMNLAFESLSTSAPAALFPYLDGVVKNLTAEKCTLTPRHAVPSGTGSAMFVGRLANGGVVDNCHLIDCQIETATANVLMAGIVGYNDCGTIRNCSVSGGEISSSKACTLGGIVGINGNTGEAALSLIENCENKGMTIRYTATGAVNADVGGIAYASHHTIRGCINRAEIYGTRFVGGIVATPSNTNADANNLSIEACANYGAIHFKPNATTSICGGIIGRLISGGTANVVSCFNAGTISIEGSKTNTVTGGIAGRGNAARVENCYNIGQIINNSGANSVVMGGICGENTNATVTNVYSIGTFVNPSNKVGAITTSATTSTYTNCYYLDSLPGLGGVGEALSESQMKDQNSYVDWDFDNTWALDAGQNNGYPTLKCFNLQ